MFHTVCAVQWCFYLNSQASDVEYFFPLSKGDWQATTYFRQLFEEGVRQVWVGVDWPHITGKTHHIEIRFRMAFFSSSPIEKLEDLVNSVEEHASDAVSLVCFAPNGFLGWRHRIALEGESTWPLEASGHRCLALSKNKSWLGFFFSAASFLTFMVGGHNTLPTRLSVSFEPQVSSKELAK